MKLLGIVLVILGLAGVAYGGLSWTRQETIVDAGPIELTAEQREGVPIPPLAGGVLLVVGAALLLKK